MNISTNVKLVREKIKARCEKMKRSHEDVTIVGVTKYADVETASSLVENGVLHLGENRADEFLEKHQIIGEKAIWHFIGTLQSRKVRGIISKVDVLHSLDRISLAKEVNKHAPGKVKCFVQVNVSGEESKQGIVPEELVDFIHALGAYEKIEVIGLMTMAPHTKDESVLRDCFKRLKEYQLVIQALSLIYAPCTELSMGMSNDYEIAIEEGATFIRLGRCLTG